MSMADTVAVMNRGTIQQVAPPQELYERPRTAWVARFIGSPPMNLFRGTRRNGSIDLGDAGSVELTGATDADETAVETGGQDDAAAASVLANDVHGDVELGVRPEDLTVSTTRPQSGNAIEGTVDTVEPMGEYILVNVSVNDQIVNAKVSEAEVARDDTVYLTFDDADAYLYDDGELVV